MTARSLAEATILIQARNAVAVLSGQISNEVWPAEEADESRARQSRRFDTAIEKAKELVTRLEAARDLFASTPHEEPPPAPIDSSAWTGRSQDSGDG